jgi:hypothetical protein
MDEEVLLSLDELVDVIEHTPEGVDHVVLLRVAKAGGVEIPPHGAKIRIFGTWKCAVRRSAAAHQVVFRREEG